MKKKARKKNVDLLAVEDKIISLYCGGETTTSLSKLYNVSDSRILYILRKNGITTRKNKSINRNTKQKIASLYSDGYTSMQLMKMFDVSNKSIFNILEELGIKSRGIGGFSRDFKKYKFDVSFFSKMTPELAYFYGFCLGDGSIAIKNKNSYLRIGIHKKDRVILDNFVKWLHAPNNMIKERKNTVILRIDNSIFRKDHSKWGLVPNKTYFPVLPKISKKMLRPFLLGFIDADGTVNFRNRNTIKIIGHKKLMKWFIKSIFILGYKGHYNYYDKYSDVWSIVDISRRNDAISLAKLLQPNKYNFILDRKWHDIKSVLMKERVIKA